MLCFLEPEYVSKSFDGLFFGFWFGFLTFGLQTNGEEGLLMVRFLEECVPWHALEKVRYPACTWNRSQIWSYFSRCFLVISLDAAIIFF